MNASPAAFTSRAPSPRSASDSRNRGCPGTFSAVGWNWTNSRSATARAGPIRHRDAVAGGDRRVGRLAEDLARAAGREQHAPARAPSPGAPSSSRNRDAGAPAVLDEQLDARACVVQSSTLGSARRALPEHAADLAARSRRARAARAGRCAPPRCRAPAAVRRRDRSARPSRSARARSAGLFDEHAHRLAVAQAVAGRHRVGRVQLGRIVRADGRRDAALRVAGIALARLGLGQDQDVAGDPRARRRRAAPAMPLPTMRKSARSSTLMCYPTIATR